MIVVDNIAVDSFKTKTVVEMLSNLGADKKALIVMPEVDTKLIKSAANIPGVKTARPVPFCFHGLRHSELR